MKNTITFLLLFVSVTGTFAQKILTPSVKLQSSHIQISEVKIEICMVLFERHTLVQYGCIGGQPQTSFRYMDPNYQQDPLYDIDGKVSSHYGFEKLNKNDIITLKVLKDAEATSIYGNRGVNGVIVVRTIKGLTKRQLRELRRQEVKNAQK